MSKLVNIFVIFTMVFSWSCKEKAIQNDQAQSSIHFDWLVGDWHQTNSEPGKETHEHWEKISDTEYTGFGLTIQGQDTIWGENMKLSKRDTIWQLSVQQAQDSVATVFVMSQKDDSSFIVNNEVNEYPKKIHYKKDGENIKAVISGGGPDIEFVFSKK